MCYEANAVWSPQGVKAQNREFEAAVAYGEAGCPTFEILVEKWKKAREAGKLSDAFLMWFFMGIKLTNEGFRYGLFNQSAFIFNERGIVSEKLATAMLMWLVEPDVTQEFNACDVAEIERYLPMADYRVKCGGAGTPERLTFWSCVKIDAPSTTWPMDIADYILQMEGKFKICDILKEVEDHHPLVAKALKEAAGEDFLNKYYFFDWVNKTWYLKVQPGQGFRP